MISTDTSANLAVVPQRRAGDRARTAALVWTGVYLAAAGALLAVSGGAVAGAVHLALLAAVTWGLLSTSSAARLVGDASPLLITGPFAYAEVPLLIAAVGTGSRFHDGAIQAAEQWLFGGQPAHSMAGALPYTWLSEILHGGYIAFYLATFVPPVLLYMRGDRRGFHETVLAFTITWVLCCGCFVAFPVQGPRYLWAAPPGVPDGPMRQLTTFFLAAGSSRGAAFPSLHMAGSVSQTLMAWRWQSRSVAWAVTIVSGLVAVGAVYGGFHYAVDMVVGGGVGAVVGVMCWKGVEGRG